MTLVEQIKAIHKKLFNPEFHEYRGDIIPAMVNDLKMKYFDEMVHHYGCLFPYYSLADSADIRAVRKASELIQSCGLRDNTPAVE